MGKQSIVTHASLPFAQIKFMTHNTPNSSCIRTKTVSDKDMASVHTYEHRTVILAQFLQRSEAAPR